jgi:hypothetical protein
VKESERKGKKRKKEGESEVIHPSRKERGEGRNATTA